jgi:hypothetical protein
LMSGREPVGSQGGWKPKGGQGEWAYRNFGIDLVTPVGEDGIQGTTAAN